MWLRLGEYTRGHITRRLYSNLYFSSFPKLFSVIKYIIPFASCYMWNLFYQFNCIPYVNLVIFLFFFICVQIIRLSMFSFPCCINWWKTSDILFLSVLDYYHLFEKVKIGNRTLTRWTKIKLNYGCSMNCRKI